jgi:hypothetical protein
MAEDPTSDTWELDVGASTQAVMWRLAAIAEAPTPKTSNSCTDGTIHSNLRYTTAAGFSMQESMPQQSNSLMKTATQHAHTPLPPKAAREYTDR